MAELSDAGAVASDLAVAMQPSTEVDASSDRPDLQRSSRDSRVDARVQSADSTSPSLKDALDLGAGPLDPVVLEAVVTYLNAKTDVQQVPALHAWRTQLTKLRGGGALAGEENSWASRAFGFDADAVRNLLDSRSLNLDNPAVATNVTQIVGRRAFTKYSLDVVGTILNRNPATDGVSSVPTEPELTVLTAWAGRVGDVLSDYSERDATSADELLARWCSDGDRETWSNPRATIGRVDALLKSAEVARPATDAADAL